MYIQYLFSKAIPAARDCICREHGSFQEHRTPMQPEVATN